MLRIANSPAQRCHTANLSVTLARDSSPDRGGATGVPVLALLDELGISRSETEVLRCLGAQHRYEFSLVERSLDVVGLGSRARLFAKNKTSIVQQGMPDLPMAPPLGELDANEVSRLRGLLTNPAPHAVRWGYR